jgi:RimJ/RimL family protein N-acetyltransferase
LAPQPMKLERLIHGRAAGMVLVMDFNSIEAAAALFESDAYRALIPARDRGFAEFFRESLDSGGALLVTDAETRRAIGSSRFFRYSEARSEVEIGWTVLARSHWGGACYRELKRLMLSHAFEFVNSVMFFVGPENFRSQRAVSKIGAVREDGPDARGQLVYRIDAAAFRAADQLPQGAPESSDDRRDSIASSRCSICSSL